MGAHEQAHHGKVMHRIHDCDWGFFEVCRIFMTLPPELVRVAANDRLRALGCLNGATRRVQLAKGESE
jgi:hypothetical protein